MRDARAGRAGVRRARRRAGEMSNCTVDTNAARRDMGARGSVGILFRVLFASALLFSRESILVTSESHDLGPAAVSTAYRARASPRTNAPGDDRVSERRRASLVHARRATRLALTTRRARAARATTPPSPAGPLSRSPALPRGTRRAPPPSPGRPRALPRPRRRRRELLRPPGRAMAWRSSGHSNAELVNNLHRNGVIEHDDVADAMRDVDRANYVIKGSGDPYQDSPQPIGYGATISAPHMHAHCLETLRSRLRPGARVLDVGSGTGYLTALFATFVGPTGVVIGIDHIPELVANSERNFRADGKPRVRIKRRSDTRRRRREARVPPHAALRRHTRRRRRTARPGRPRGTTRAGWADGRHPSGAREARSNSSRWISRRTATPSSARRSWGSCTCRSAPRNISSRGGKQERERNRRDVPRGVVSASAGCEVENPRERLQRREPVEPRTETTGPGAGRHAQPFTSRPSRTTRRREALCGIAPCAREEET